MNIGMYLGSRGGSYLGMPPFALLAQCVVGSLNSFEQLNKLREYK